jgi:alpha-ketoglutarate-dependent taurine dioxygenase
MEALKTKDLGLKKFKKIQPRPVDLLEGELVRIGPAAPGLEFPIAFQPSAGDVDLADWAVANRDVIEEKLRRHGAALFRGFDTCKPADFEKLAQAICPDLYGEYGDLPKADTGDVLYRSTPYPADKAILFHNESSHTPCWPMRQFFYCVKASRTGGETPLVDCRAIYRKLDPAVRAKFAEKGLMYVRNFTEGFDVSWQDFFKTDDRSVVEEYCRQNSIGVEWRSNGNLRMWQLAPAVLHHSETGEPLFFNQIQLHHVACLEDEVRESLLSLFPEEDLPRNVYYGDGTPIEDALVREILALYWETCVALPWQEGDIIALDNMLIAHARNPFEGERKILVAMGRMFERKDLQQVS